MANNSASNVPAFIAEIFRSGEPTSTVKTLAPVVGTIAGSNSNGEILVKIEDFEAVPARLLAGLNRAELMRETYQGCEALLVFEKGDPARPIIIGLLENPLETILAAEFADDNESKPGEIRVDGKRLTFEAEDEVLLKCGKGSIHLRKDGKIIIKGTHILSRSSGPNRVKGASVAIN